MYAIRATYLPKPGMYFDHDYYAANHMRIAAEQLSGRVNYLQMYAEFDVRTLMDASEARSPCMFVLIVEREEDVEAFRQFRLSPHVMPVREDAKKYTNCDLEWTVARIVES
jgi:hypothetical protein